MARKQYQARWISKARRDFLKKSGAVRSAILLDSVNGFLIVEPVGSNLGDGDILRPETADAELSDAWCLEPRTKLAQARGLLEIQEKEPTPVFVGVS